MTIWMHWQGRVELGYGRPFRLRIMIGDRRSDSLNWEDVRRGHGIVRGRVK